jgi:hypothetical protein
MVHDKEDARRPPSKLERNPKSQRRKTWKKLPTKLGCTALNKPLPLLTKRTKDVSKKQWSGYTKDNIIPHRTHDLLVGHTEYVNMGKSQIGSSEKPSNPKTPSEPRDAQAQQDGWYG